MDKIASLASVLEAYRSKGRAIAAINVDSFEFYLAAEKVARETGLPIIVQLSDGEDGYFGGERLLMLVKKAQAEGVPLYTNMDHGKRIDRLTKLARLGFDMVHFDGSAMEWSLNLAITKELVESVGEVIVEGEVDKIGGDEESDPKKVIEMVERTGIKLVAVAVGNQHGVNPGGEHINMPLLTRIGEAVEGKAGVVLHGGSGIPMETVLAGVRGGVVKVNFNTDNRIIFGEELRHQLTMYKGDRVYEIMQPIVEKLSINIRDKVVALAE